jgi:hypothetical protein
MADSSALGDRVAGEGGSLGESASRARERPLAVCRLSWAEDVEDDNRSNSWESLAGQVEVVVVVVVERCRTSSGQLGRAGGGVLRLVRPFHAGRARGPSDEAYACSPPSCRP